MDIPKQEEDYINIEDDEVGMEVQLTPEVKIPFRNTPFDVYYQVSAESIKEAPDAKAQINNRIYKYFKYNQNIEPGKQHFRPRREPAYQQENVQPIPNMLVLFGCDFKKYKALKAEYNTSEIYGINDSNCRMVFRGFDEAWAAIIKNAKDPSTIIHKVEGQNHIYVPRCWFQMKPYIILERQVDVQVRFATTEDLQIQKEKEQLIDTYKQSREKFNFQENRRREEEYLEIQTKRQKLDFKKQKNSENLYKRYEQHQNSEWQTGKNRNPGANRNQDNSRQRSRSRSRQRKQRITPNQENDDSKSSYSYGGLNKEFNKMTLVESNSVVPRQEELDLSFDMTGGNAEAKEKSILCNQPSNIQGESASEYQWKGSECQKNTKWIYQDYVRKTELQEEQKRRRLIPVIYID